MEQRVRRHFEDSIATKQAAIGLAPAIGSSRHDVTDAFKEDGTRTAGSRRTGWLRRLLVAAELALCMVLLVGAGLLLQTFLKLRAIDPGFDISGVLTARMPLQGDRYATPAALNRFYAEGLVRIRSLPGVHDAAVVNGVPLAFAKTAFLDSLGTFGIPLTNHDKAVADTFPAAITSVSWTCAALAGSTCGAPNGTGNISQLVNLAIGGTVIFNADATLKERLTQKMQELRQPA